LTQINFVLFGLLFQLFPITVRREALLDAGKEVGLEVNSKKIKYMFISRKKAGQKHSMKVANRSLKVCQNSNIWGQH
jgi:hypothetical protein